MPGRRLDHLTDGRGPGAERMRAQRRHRGVGLVVRDHGDELALVRDVDRVDAEHVAGAEDLWLHGQRLLVEDDADTGGLRQLVAHGAESAPGGVAHPPRARCRGQQRLDHLGDRCGVGDDVVGLDGEVAAGEHHGHPVVTQGPGEHQPVSGPDQVGAQLTAGRDHADPGRGDVQPVGRSLRDHLRVTGDDLHAGRVGRCLHVGDDRPEPVDHEPLLDHERRREPLRPRPADREVVDGAVHREVADGPARELDGLHHERVGGEGQALLRGQREHRAVPELLELGVPEGLDEDVVGQRRRRLAAGSVRQRDHLVDQPWPAFAELLDLEQHPVLAVHVGRGLGRHVAPPGWAAISSATRRRDCS